ncbi:MAG: GntR family transcriptional regulator [Pseudomonadota bacterium]
MANLATARPLPKSVQVSEMLIREIASGRLADGARLPTERQMAADLGIAIGTLRKALAVLADKGLLERRQGSGNYVRAQTNVDSVYTLFRLELLAGGGLPTADVLDVLKLKRPEEATGFSGKFGHRIRRLRYLNGQPIAVEEIWLDTRYTGEVQAANLVESLYKFYKEALGLVISQVEDRVGVSTVPDWAPCAFERPLDTACGFIERLGYDQQGRTAEYSRTWFNQDAVRYTIRLR